MKLKEEPSEKAYRNVDIHLTKNFLILSRKL